MKHLAEVTEPFELINLTIDAVESLPELGKNNALIFDISKGNADAKRVYNSLKEYISAAPKTTIFNFIGNHEMIAELAFLLEKGSEVYYQYLITLRKELNADNGLLPSETILLLTMSKEKKIKISRVLLPYTYCPECEKTTKDYGGKKHTFHHFGTTMSDVWKDIVFNVNETIFSDQNTIIVERIALMLSKRENTIFVCDLSNFYWSQNEIIEIEYPRVINIFDRTQIEEIDGFNQIINGDSLSVLKSLPSESIDYVFIDPPYNLEKKYSSYSDDLDIESYFEWCDEWIEESLRVLKNGSYISILNIPQWCIRHFVYLAQRAEYDSWITWDSLSKPAGSIMPANYTILTFRKNNGNENIIRTQFNTEPIYMQPIEEGYCLRASCIKKREKRITKTLSDLWTDIHRLKHNSLRYDHPCQLPADLMKRVIEVYTDEGDTVLDFFNGVGTTTLSAELINRNYIGVDLDPKYVEVAQQRHQMISLGQNPFAKNNISNEEKTKNNELKRIGKRKPEHQHISKKDVQLKMKLLYQQLGRTPTIEDALEFFPEIPKEFYELYFKSWSEVIVAIKVDGVKENKGNLSKKRTYQESFEI